MDQKRVCFREESAAERWSLVEVRLYGLYSFITESNRSEYVRKFSTVVY